MKISSVSKKVLASALSAAMVVAFAPTAAFGATPTIATADDGTTAVVKVSYQLENTATGKKSTTEGVEFYTLAKAVAAGNAAVDKIYYNGQLKADDSSDGYEVFGSGTSAVTSYEKVTGVKIELAADASVGSAGINSTNAPSSTGVDTTSLNVPAEIALGGKTVTVDAYRNAAAATTTLSGTGTVGYGSEFNNVVVAAGADVTFAEGVKIYGTLTVEGAATIAKDNSTYIADVKGAVSVVKGGKLTIDGGTFASTVNAGDDSETKKVSAGEITINGGVFAGEVTAGRDSSVVFNGGVFKGGSANGVAVTAAQNSADNGVIARAAGHIEVNAGSFKVSGSSVALGSLILDAVPSTSEVGAAAQSVSDDTTYYVTVGAAVATYGGTGYTTVAAAMDAANGEVVKLTEAAANSKANITIPGKACKLDLNGQTLTEITIDATTVSGSLVITGNGTLAGVTVLGNVTFDKYANVTVKNSVTTKAGKETTVKSKFETKAVGAAVNQDPASAPAAATVTVNGALTIEDAAVDEDVAKTATAPGIKYTASGIAVGANAKVTIAKGSFGALSADEKGSLTISQGTSTAKVATKFVAAGAVTNQKASALYEVGAPVASVEKKEKAADGVTEYVTTIECASLTGAVYNAAAGDTVKLTADTKETVTVAKAVTIDLGANNINGSIAAGDNLTIKGTGSIAAADASALTVASGKTVKIQGGTFSAAKDKGASIPVAITNNSGTIEFYGGTVKGNRTYAFNTLTGVTFMGGTFDWKVNPASNYQTVANADGTYTVKFQLAEIAEINNTQTGAGKDLPGAIAVTGPNTDTTIAKAVTAVVSDLYQAARPVNPDATTLDGIKFATGKSVRDLTAGMASGMTYKYAFETTASKVAADETYEIVSGKSYAFDVVLYVYNSSATTYTKIGTLTGVSYTVTLTDAAEFVDGSTAKIAGYDAVIDTAAKTATFAATGSADFAVEKVDKALAEIEEIKKPAAEKATQSIDVAKKSKTVALKGAKKTKKAQSFSMGASAETKLTTSKKSGSKYITVSGNKVTLKKGVKKGTFTAKVSLKAASSDEYLAAAKTITVKFVVKK